MFYRLIHAKRVISGYVREFIGGSVKRVISGCSRGTCYFGLFWFILVYLGLFRVIFGDFGSFFP